MIRSTARLPPLLLLLAVLGGPAASPVRASEPPDGTPLALGVAPFDLGSDHGDNADAVTVDSAGRPVLGGFSNAGLLWSVATLARFTPAGALDPSFGVGGRVVNPLGWTEGASVVTDLAALPDGRLLAAGYARHPTITGGDNEVLVFRLTAGGALDTTFFPPFGFRLVKFNAGGSGNNVGRGMAIQDDRRIVLAGRSDFACGIARLLANGAFDTSFDDDGRDTFTIAGFAVCWAEDVVVAGDGRISSIALAGEGSTIAFGYARFLPFGGLDPSFDSDGSVAWLPDVLPGAEDHLPGGLALARDGGLVGVGYARAAPGSARVWLVERVTFVGSLDPLFGDDGAVAGDFPCFDVPLPVCGSADPQSFALDVALQGDGRIVVVGAGTLSSSSGILHLAAARLLPDGTLDPAFGAGGQLVVDVPWGIGTGIDVATSVALAPDGRIVLAGWSEYDGTDVDFAVARLANSYVFADGFESGTTARWSAAAGN